MRKHTPGPWKADIRMGCYAIYPAHEKHNCLCGAELYAIVYGNGKGERNEPDGYHTLTNRQIDDALLMAAAPELLRILEEKLSSVEIEDVYKMIDSGGNE